MNTRATIGIAVASCDEAALLDACLDAAHQAFDQVVVYDLESTDETHAVAARHGAAVKVLPRPRFVELIRGAQLESAATDWILFLDPDERLPEGWLSAARQAVDLVSADTAAIWLGYREVAFGRSLQHTRIGASKIALLRRSLVEAVPPERVRPHEPMSLNGRAVGPLNALPLIEHHGYRSVVESIAKLSRYASNGGVGTSVSTASVGPLTLMKMLWGSIVMNRAYQDGSPGVAVASLSAIGDYLGLLCRWDSDGRPDAQVSKGQIRAIGTLRSVHRLQWLTRSKLTRRQQP